MNETIIKNLIHSYIKENLRVELNSSGGGNYGYDSPSISVTVYLGSDEIYSSSTSI